MRQGSWNDLKDRVKALEEQVEAQSMEIARLKERREPPITREHQFDWRERGKPVSRGVNEMISDKLPGGFMPAEGVIVTRDDPTNESWHVVCPHCGTRDKITAVELAREPHRVPIFCNCGKQLLRKETT